MSKYDKLSLKSEEAIMEAKKEASNLPVIEEESKRVSNVASHASELISDIDNQFADLTRLDRSDISFLFLAIALRTEKC